GATEKVATRRSVSRDAEALRSGARGLQNAFHGNKEELATHWAFFATDFDRRAGRCNEKNPDEIIACDVGSIFALHAEVGRDSMPTLFRCTSGAGLRNDKVRRDRDAGLG